MIDVTHLYCPATGLDPGNGGSTHHLVATGSSRRARAMICIHCRQTEQEIRDMAAPIPYPPKETTMKATTTQSLGVRGTTIPAEDLRRWLVGKTGDVSVCSHSPDRPGETGILRFTIIEEHS